MTTQTLLDPSGLRSWDEAFQHPMPTVRQLSVKLRKNIEDHRTRLRSLVGASYRDLLGTAERIIEMDGQMQAVEEHLGRIGRRCNAGAVERKLANAAGLEDGMWEGGRRQQQQQQQLQPQQQRLQQRGGGESARLAGVAQCKVLSTALGTVARIVKRGGDALQAAKLMVLARLLFKSAAEGADPPAVLEQQRRSIAGLRRRLLRYIDRSLGGGGGESSGEEVTATLSAYALLTSSAPRDVLRHLLAVRVAQLEALVAAGPAAETVLAMLELYAGTMVSVRALFPRRVGEALAELSTVPLLSDPQIRTVEELGIDVYGRWIAEDIKTFTSWTRQESFSAAEVREASAAFGSQARGVLLQGLRKCVRGVESAGGVLEIRRNIIGAYLSMSTKIKGDDSVQEVEEMREVFIVRLEELAGGATTLDDLAFDASVSGRSIIADEVGSPLWSLASQELELSGGAMELRSLIVRHRNGYGMETEGRLAPLGRWVQQVEGFWQGLGAMRGTKWSEHIEVDEDEVEGKDAETLQEQLSVQDPRRVEERMRETTGEALANAFGRLRDAAERDEERRPAHYLRMMRELEGGRREVSRLIGQDGLTLAGNEELARMLHERLAETVAVQAVQKFEGAWRKKQYVAVELWEGSPALPTAPQPMTFRLCVGVQRSMAAMGEDVWSGEAVKVLKDHLGHRLRKVLEDEDTEEASVVGEATNGEKRDEGEERDGEDEGAQEHSEVSKVEDEKEEQQAGVQRMFDGLYLSRALGVARLQPAMAKLKKRAGVEDAGLQRMEKKAVEYWKRTYLLFGLLAGGAGEVRGLP